MDRNEDFCLSTALVDSRAASPYFWNHSHVPVVVCQQVGSGQEAGRSTLRNLPFGVVLAVGGEPTKPVLYR